MLGGCHRKLRRRIWEQCNDEESGSGGVLAGAVLAAHAKRVLLSLHEKRGEPLTACLCPPTFPFASALCAAKLGSSLPLPDLPPALPPAAARVSGTPCVLVVLELLWDGCPGCKQAASVRSYFTHLMKRIIQLSRMLIDKFRNDFPSPFVCRLCFKRSGASQV